MDPAARTRALCALGIIASLTVVGGAAAAVMTSRYEASARVSTHNGFHHDGVRDIDMVQQRNELRFDLRYHLIPPGDDIGILDELRFNILYRARYDSIFDIRSQYRRRGYDRDDFRFPEGKLPRELFLDFNFAGPLAPFSARIGKQQVVWGEADLFRSLDVVNPLRLDQNGLIGEDFADYREPLWIAKFLWNVGNLGPLSQTNFEFFYSANWRPLSDRALIGEGLRIGVDTNNGLTGFSRQNRLPFRQVRHPWEISRVGPYRTEGPDQADVGADPTTCDDVVEIDIPNPFPQTIPVGCGDFVYLIQNGAPTSTFDFRSASMVGARLIAKSFANLDVTVNYIFKRSELPGISAAWYDLFDRNVSETGGENIRRDLLLQLGEANATPDLDGNGVPDGSDELLRRCIFEKEPLFVLRNAHGPHPDGTSNTLTGCETVGIWYPWQHIIGATATYNDFDYTGAVLRLEQSFSTKEPRLAYPPFAGRRAGDWPRTGEFDTHSKRTTGVWRSMIGFDYIRSIWSPAPKWMQHYWLSTFLKDQWLFSGQFFTEYWTHVEDQVGQLVSITDRQYHWNPVLTLLMTGFFHHNKLRPQIAMGYDVNTQFPVMWLQAEYYLTPKLTLRVGDILYMGSRYSESFLFLNKYANRDTLFFRLTYFLI